jgi:hypothetical protein
LSGFAVEGISLVAANYLAFIKLASIRIWLLAKRMAITPARPSLKCHVDAFRNVGAEAG